jgi:hypothetical protein
MSDQLHGFHDHRYSKSSRIHEHVPFVVYRSKSLRMRKMSGNPPSQQRRGTMRDELGQGGLAWLAGDGQLEA